MLGVHLALDRSMKNKLQHLVSILKAWQGLMTKAKLTHSATEFSISRLSYKN